MNIRASLPGVVRGLGQIPPEPAFDLVVALDVLEHISDPAAALGALRQRAAPGAELYAAFPNNDSWRARQPADRTRGVMSPASVGLPRAYGPRSGRSSIGWPRR